MAALLLRSAVALLTAGALGCGGEGGAEDGPEEEGGRAGTGTLSGRSESLAVSERPLWGAERRWRVSARPVFEHRFAGAERRQVIGATRLSDGKVAVLESGNHEIVLFQPNGLLRRRFGGAGMGPGQLMYPTQLLLLPGDTLAVWDNPAQRIHRYSASGATLPSIPVDWVGLQRLSDRAFGSEVAEALPDGRLLVQLFETVTRLDSSTGPFRPGAALLVVDPDLARVDTLAVFGRTEQVRARVGQETVSVIGPQPRSTHIAFGGRPLRVCLGEAMTYEILCLVGTERMRIRWAEASVPLGEQEVEAWRTRTAARYRGQFSPEEIGEILEQVPVPATRAPYAGVLVDGEGYVWVRRAPSEADPAPGGVHWVFSPDGRWLGEVVLPRARILEIGVDYLLGVEEGPLGEEAVRVWALERIGS